MSMKRDAQDYGALLLRLLLGALFIAHLFWKVVILPGGVAAWWHGLMQSGYPALVPAYVLSAEILGAFLLVPGVQARWVALYAMPMMAGAAEFWLVRTGFYFTKSGAELPLVWLALLCLQIVLGDGAFALVKSTAWSSRSARRVQSRSSGQA
jgi:putative oxidoreductase